MDLPSNSYTFKKLLKDVWASKCFAFSKRNSLVVWGSNKEDKGEGKAFAYGGETLLIPDKSKNKINEFGADIARQLEIIDRIINLHVKNPSLVEE